MTYSAFFFGGQNRYFYSVVILTQLSTKALQKQVFKHYFYRVTQVKTFYRNLNILYKSLKKK